MAEELLLIKNFSGGISSASKVAQPPGSFRFGRGLDIHTDPDKLSINPASTKDSGSTVVDLPLFGSTNTVNDNLYFLGDAGKLYKRTSAGVWSILSTYTDAQGMGFFSGTNLIYFVSNNQQYTLDPSNDGLNSYRALNSADWHPVESFLDKIFTGNGRELISTDASAIDYDSATTGGGITIDFNYTIRCLKNLGNWLFIGATSDNSSDARYFLWDGYSDDYNYSRTLKGEDGINAVDMADDGTVLIFAGKKGHIYQLTGESAPLTPVKTIPLIEKDKTIEIYPGSVCNYQGDNLFGISNGTSITAERGVYSWTYADINYPTALNFDYAISTETTTGITLQIGALLAPNSTDLFIGWRDGANYGVDKIDGTGAQTTAVMETLIHDASRPFQRKRYKNFKIKLAGNLAADEVITVSYKADRASSFTSMGTIDYSVDGAINVKNFKPDILAYELELQLSFANAGNTAPSIDSIIAIYDIENLI